MPPACETLALLVTLRRGNFKVPPKQRGQPANPPAPARRHFILHHWGDAPRCRIIMTLADIESLSTILALVVGGIWAYYKIFKARVFTPRLETHIDARWVVETGASHILARVKLKNVGLTRVNLHQEGSALRLWKQEMGRSTAIRSVRWKETADTAFTVFEDHGWIEPGETIEDELLIRMPDDDGLIVRLQVRLVGSRHGVLRTERRYAWKQAIILPRGRIDVHDRIPAGNSTHKGL